jgi:hypothetical protein
MKLQYAFNGTALNGRVAGARGNLRDSFNFVFDPQLTNRILYNACPIFEGVF